MPTSTYTYNLDGAMTTSAEGTSAEGAAASGNATTGEQFSSIRRHDYTRLPIEITGSGGVVTLRYDSSGRRLHKTSGQTILYRNGMYHPAADRTKELKQGDEIHHPLVEHTNNDEIIYLFTPAGQTVTRRAEGYTRIERDHLRSVRVETYLPLATCHLPFNAASITAHYSAYGKAIISGGELRRAFAGYEWDAEVALYNANQRLYSPSLRLFVSLDPRLQNASPYPYCGSDPFNNVDPTGGTVASTVSGIVSGILLVIGIIATIVTEGLATPAVIAGEGTLNTGEGLFGGAIELESLDSVAEATMETDLATPMPLTLSGFTKAGALIAGASALISNGASLATQAIQGEHISAWQVVRSMIIEPIIAAVSGGVGGRIAGIGLAAANGWRLALGFSALGAAAASAIDSISNAAISGQLTTRAGWENIGITVGIAVGESLALASVFGLVKGVPKGAMIERIEYADMRYSPQPTALDQSDRFYRFIHPDEIANGVTYPRRNKMPQYRKMTYNLPRPRVVAEPPAPPGVNSPPPGFFGYFGTRDDRPHLEYMRTDEQASSDSP
jgi:RHS repeat-associated protein